MRHCLHERKSPQARPEKNLFRRLSPPACPSPGPFVGPFGALVALKANFRTRLYWPYGAGMTRDTVFLWLWAIWIVLLVGGVAYVLLQ